MKNKKVKHLGRRINALMTCLQIASMILVVALCISMFYSLAMSLLKDRCVNATNILAYELDGYVGPEDKNETLDELKGMLNCEFTIFNGDVRTYTTIQQNGERVVGTKLSDELSEIVLKQGQSYIGKAEILGVEHLCSYVPTKDENGQINGLIFAGISVQAATEQINGTVKMACIVGVVAVIISIMIMSVFVSGSVSKPLAKLTGLAQMMEHGDLGLKTKHTLKVDIRTNDEIGYLTRIFQNMMENLKGYIGEISVTLAAISDGNLTVETTMDYVGDFVSIKESLDEILKKLNGTMSQIMESTDYVSNGADQMSVGAQSLSQGSVEQASTVEGLEMNVREISQRISQSAENAQQASQMVESVGTQIMESNQKMQEMIDAMREINESSNEISKIIKTIESIASQTNILALNAAVEAARAGEAGKGFAVVAEEVRALAGKSAEASKTTTDLIESSIQRVEHGSMIASEMASQLEFVVSGANQVMETTTRIADDSRMQAAAVSDIQEQISQISCVVQTNSAIAEESAATSEELSSQTKMLKNLTDMFHVRSL
ncbi:methyl-accepting chemotaxis protein [Lachnospiraceae bacterium MD335]|nr:methyl-accepting chemotaxis protein [Lachnospiraceae bacterium MD335]